MQSLEKLVSLNVSKAVDSLFGVKVEPGSVTFQRTNPQFEGDITLVVFPYVKLAGKSPEQTAQQIGDYLKANMLEVERFNVVKGFLNLVIGPEFWLKRFYAIAADESYGNRAADANSPFVMVEYSSPNTNKPLHLGHIRNNLLGYSVSEILKAAGNKVMMVNLVNDRGIHICKSMLAWQKWGNGETPGSSGMKGDHLVGKYYVEFDKHYKAEVAGLKAAGKSDEEAEKLAPLMLEAQEMLRKWEAGDKEVKALWKKMNGWVYDGFAETYKKLGVRFDKIYYESQTYLLGKSIVEEGLKKGVLQKRADGAVVIDNTDSGLDVKVLLRSDGTSVYMTQDLGTAEERHKEFPFDKHIYVVGNEQEYHFKTLKVCLKKLGHDWADGLYHLSYGMVELPEGKMKSREGTVVDADDLIDAMEKDARELAEEKGLIEGMDEAEKSQLFHKVGMAALKYFILKVDPKKKMLFNPKESIDLHGNTGPFIQYTYVRTRSIWRKAGLAEVPKISTEVPIHPKEKELIKLLYQYPSVISESAQNYSPALVANFAYELAKTYNQFFDACPVLKEEDEQLRNFRLVLCLTVGRTIKSAMGLLGIEVPERM
jgi:arginyl-tRNA synthetase